MGFIISLGCSHIIIIIIYYTSIVVSVCNNVQHFIYLFIYLFIQHLLARPKTANKHERSGDSQPRQAKKGKKKKDVVREGKEIGREKEREAH